MSKYKDEYDDLEASSPKWTNPEFAEDEDDAADLAPNLKLLMDEENEDDDDEEIIIIPELPVEEKATPKLVGKHSLGYDSIFKGKRTEPSEYENDVYNDGFNFDASSVYHQESFESAEYHHIQELKEKLHELILTKTDININSNRRKPSRVDFNKYYRIVVDNLHKQGFSLTELFVELAFYFSENLFNMFKLLDKDYAESIITELKERKNLDFLDDYQFL